MVVSVAEGAAAVHIWTTVIPSVAGVVREMAGGSVVGIVTETWTAIEI